MGMERMKPFSLRCEDAFHEQFKGISFPDDAAIHIWREAWFAAMKHFEGTKNGKE